MVMYVSSNKLLYSLHKYHTSKTNIFENIRIISIYVPPVISVFLFRYKVHHSKYLRVYSLQQTFKHTHICIYMRTYIYTLRRRCNRTYRHKHTYTHIQGVDKKNITYFREIISVLKFSHIRKDIGNRFSGSCWEFWL